MRKRRTKYTWFPVIGGDTAADGEGSINLSTQTRSVPVVANGDIASDIIPLIPDEPAEEASQGDHLVDFIGTSWFIKRLVGKLHLSYSQNNGAPQSGGSTVIIPQAVVVVAGFFVARVDAADVSVPIGDNNDINKDYSPLALATQREPWIWRRSWILGNNAALANTNQFPQGFSFPSTNASRSVVDGPHIDAKTARRSMNDERLWFAITTHRMDSSEGGADDDGELVYCLDLRVLGAIRKQRNRSAF